MNIEQGKAYFILQLKRISRLLMPVLLSSLLLTGVVALVLYMVIRIDSESAAKQKVKIGVVGDFSDSYLGLGIRFLANFDSSRFSVDFLEMNAEEARKALTGGEIAVAITVPDGFMEGLERGETIPITYTTAGGPGDVGALLISELAQAVADFMSETQRAIYAMQAYYRYAGDNADMPLHEATVALNLRFLDYILARSHIYELNELGLSHRLTLPAYYFCAVIILLLLLWGIAAAAILAKNEWSLGKLLAARGFGAPWQVLCEYLPFALFVAVNFLIGVLCFGGADNLTGGRLSFWTGGLGGGLRFWLALLPVLLMVAAMQFLWYELVSGVVNAVLAQFVLALSLAYMSGLFYPLSFFPAAVQEWARLLPTAVALSYATDCLGKQAGGGELFAVVAYLLVFLFLGVLARGWRLRRETT
jgi:ABC-2 type transport system permease protein